MERGSISVLSICGRRAPVAGGKAFLPGNGRRQRHVLYGVVHSGLGACVSASKDPCAQGFYRVDAYDLPLYFHSRQSTQNYENGGMFPDGRCGF